MRYVCNAAYVLMILVTWPWLLWQAVRHGKYRQGLAAKVLGRVPHCPTGTRCIWFHAVSVGEVMVLEPLVREARQKWPERRFVITSTSRTGFELARRRFADETVTYAPLDFSWAVAAAIRRLRPEMLVLVELELWPNLIMAAHRADVQLAIVNGRLSAQSARGYARIRAIVARLLSRFDFIGAQNQEYAERFLTLGAPSKSVHVTGSMKFDGARTDRDNPRTRRLAAWAQLSPQETLFLAGSTQAPEEKYALDAYLALKKEYPELRLALVPRHPERFEEVAGMLAGSGVTWARRSEGLAHDSTAAGDAEVLLIDTVGELADWWGAAKIGFVGGSFGSRGGQNMIEPAAMGVATCFGPNTVNFREISEALVRANAAVVVDQSEELVAFVRSCLADRSNAGRLGQRAVAFVESQRGALSRTIVGLDAVLDQRPASSKANREFGRSLL